MIIIRPAKVLAKRMGIKIQPSAEKSTNILGDWHAQSLVFEQKQLIFCMSEHGRLPLILTAAPYAEFPNRFADQLLELLLAIGVEESKARKEWEQSREFTLSSSNNRSVIGVMNQFHLDLEYSDPRIPLNREKPLQLSLFLANSGTLTLAEFHPIDAVLKLFSQPPRSIEERADRPKLYLVKN